MQQVREIEVGAIPTRFARGWHCLGTERQFRDGQPHAIEAFGTKLVVFADSQGVLRVLDAYCRHMGGDLSRGSIKGDSVACPFHDWRWNGDGRCSLVPYAKRTPRRARTRSWITCQQNGLLFVWHDHEGNPPSDDVAIPRIDDVFSDRWTDWAVKQWRIDRSHSREIVDNLADTAHFFYVHDGFPTSFRNVFEGHTASQYLTNRGRADTELGPEFGRSLLKTESTYYGPAYVVTYLHNSYGELRTEAILIAFHYPVDEDSFMLHNAVSVQKPDGLDPATTDKLARMVADGVMAGFEQDVEIFQHKAKIDNPLLCDEDGPIYQLRRWYEQFYVDAADVTPDMTARVEFEVNTDYSVSVWTREVEENVAILQSHRAAATSAPTT
ncbi:3-ketosteroid-9-alpha-hydroxylase [Mycobacterium sp. IS-1742]|uniref:Rieske 2Fe-2S domain-containing protein n=1 Tax=Mycobacterium sp. IS-1742 TaxID=1772285 RepID=UPI000740213C|nr:Rieske 2Fe-2S domain-containing protein [Mycobacterium sp. IS-1742]KUI30916.1 3-ketosteroid-9-alpha-hydroxylase [Mycobacterium sp. IS-1742]